MEGVNCRFIRIVLPRCGRGLRGSSRLVLQVQQAAHQLVHVRVGLRAIVRRVSGRQQRVGSRRSDLEAIARHGPMRALALGVATHVPAKPGESIVTMERRRDALEMQQQPQLETRHGHHIVVPFRHILSFAWLPHLGLTTALGSMPSLVPHPMEPILYE